MASPSARWRARRASIRPWSTIISAPNAACSTPSSCAGPRSGTTSGSTPSIAMPRRSGEAMTLEGLLEAFLRPPFEWSLKGGPGWKHYSRAGGPDQRQPDLRRRDHGPLFRPGDPAADRADRAGSAGRARRRSVLGLAQSVGSPDPDAGRDRASGPAVERTVPLRRSGDGHATIWSGSPQRDSARCAGRNVRPVRPSAKADPARPASPWRPRFPASPGSRRRAPRSRLPE